MTKEQSKYLEETLLHKSLVLQVGAKVLNYLYENKEYDIAKKLCIALFIHDNSKLENEEYNSMPYIEMSNNSSMKNPLVLPDEEITKIIAIHWKNNSHHPEHYEDYNDMSRVDILEMVCDWGARSIQYNTNLLEFAKVRLENRFSSFSDENKKEILKFCEIISN